MVDHPPGRLIVDDPRAHHGRHGLHPRALARRLQRPLLHQRREVPRRRRRRPLVHLEGVLVDVLVVVQPQEGSPVEDLPLQGGLRSPVAEIGNSWTQLQ